MVWTEVVDASWTVKQGLFVRSGTTGQVVPGYADMTPADAAMLQPRSPPRLGNARSDRYARLLLLGSADQFSLGLLAETWSREALGVGCTLLADTDAEADAASTCRSNLLDGRLSLVFDAWPDDRIDTADLAFIDFFDQRLRQRLATDDLQGAIRKSERRESVQKALYAIADLAHADLDLHDMLARVHAIVGGLTYAESFYIALYDDTRDTLRFAYDADLTEAEMARGETEIAGPDYPHSLTFAVVHSKRALLGPSAALRHSLGLGDDERLGPECVDWLGVPMIEGERVRGAVVVQSYDPARRYSEDDRALLMFVAQHILTAVRRKQAQDELEQAVARRTAELAEANLVLRAEVTQRERAQSLQGAMYRIAELSAGHGSLDHFFAGVHQVIGQLLDASNFFIALLSDDGESLSFPYFVDELDQPLATRQVTNGITEWVLRQRRPLLSHAAGIRGLIDAGEMVVFGTVPEFWLGVPLLLDDRSVGAMVVQSYDPDRGYSNEDQEILLFASLHVATALERKQNQERLVMANAELERRVFDRTQELRLANEGLHEQIHHRERIESQLKHEAFHDALTGLPNRSAMLTRLDAALARYRNEPDGLFAVLFLDLDRFKVINDSVGHLIGDEMLIEAARRINGCVRAPDTVARLGGDEFTILLSGINGIDDASQIAQRVIDAFDEPIRVRDKELYTSASIGIAIASARYQNPEELLRDADVAMYRAKARGRRRFEVFDQKLHEQALLLLDLEGDLRRAIVRREFEPFLQPIVRLKDARVLGYEALLRWRHGLRGVLTPIDFLGLAEESGNVEQIDWLRYEQIVRLIPRLIEPDAYIGINVSPRHFRSPNLAQDLLGLMATHNVQPHRIRIEVTEGVLLDNPDQARHTMQRLKDAGVLTSLADFGTGYSSLSYLHRFPLHALKIDRSFVSELKPDLSGKSAAVVRAIRALAGSLGIEVIAEGIETEMQRDALLRLDCDLGQGFLFARPRPAG
ncbi:MAG: EAL domain-containing protein [Ahniella sp.]|nr:EAL domain-containing protein [Ahniella sp.]